MTIEIGVPKSTRYKIVVTKEEGDNTGNGLSLSIIDHTGSIDARKIRTKIIEGMTQLAGKIPEVEVDTPKKRKYRKHKKKFRKHVKWNNKTKNTIAEFIQDGKSVKYIARELGATRAAIQKGASKYQLGSLRKSRLKRSRKKSDESFATTADERIQVTQLMGNLPTLLKNESALTWRELTDKIQQHFNVTWKVRENIYARGLLEQMKAKNLIKAEKRKDDNKLVFWVSKTTVHVESKPTVEAVKGSKTRVMG